MNVSRFHSLLTCAVLGILLSCPASSQDKSYWIYLRDKGPVERSNVVQTDLSPEAMERRIRTRGKSNAVDEADRPLYEPYIAQLLAAGVRLRAASKWMNVASASIPDSLLHRLLAMSFVSRIEPVRILRRQPEESEAVPAVRLQKSASAEYKLDYGSSLDQLEVINVPRVHDIWIDGTGITVGMLDNGFRWREHEAMKGIRVLGEYDFINKDSVTENEGNDPFSQDAHGTLTFSTLAGYKQGVLIGPAYRASFYLAKTEENGRETQVEEDYWVQGLEWLEANGVSVVSSSLAYSEWDDKSGYTYQNGDFDGKTAITTRAAARAAGLGVVVANAMGNEGNISGTILAPADADSILSVGAISITNVIAGFSSNGPTNDNRIKPDIVAPGIFVFSASKGGNDSYARSNGTSMSTPLAAGVAALIRSARPELSPLQVRDAMRNTADRAASPDNSYGWGKVDAWAALLFHGMVISTNPKVLWNEKRNVLAVYVVSHDSVDPASVRVVFNVDGSGERQLQLNWIEPVEGGGSGSGLYTAIFPELPTGSTVRYYIKASDETEQRMSPFGAPATTHSFTAGESSSDAGGILPTSISLHQNFPNPVQGKTTMIRYDLPPPGGPVSLEICNSIGQRVALLVNEQQSGGMYLVRFDTGTLRSGVYHYTLSTGIGSLSRTMLLLRIVRMYPVRILPGAVLSSFTLSFGGSVVLLVAMVLAATAYSIYVYRHTVPEVSPSRRILLTSLRSLALFLLLVILFEPVLNLHNTETLSPRTAILVDDSKSMSIEDRGVPRDDLVRRFIEGEQLSGLATRGEVTGYVFSTSGRALEELSPDSVRFGGAGTDITAALEQVSADLSERNLRSIVLVSDGNYTSGRNPVYIAERLGVPVHVVAVGDSSEKRDLLVSNVLANEIAYVESSIPVDVSIRSAGFENGIARVSLLEGDRVIETKEVVLASGRNEYPLSFRYVPESRGMKKMTVAIAPHSGELTGKNNRRTFFIRVRKSKMKIVMVAGAPGPDVSLIKQVVDRDKNLSLTGFVQKFGSAWYKSTPGKESMIEADCIILAGFPLSSSAGTALEAVRAAVEQGDKPLLILPSRRMDLEALRSALGSYLPFDILQIRGNETEVFFHLTAEGRRNPIVNTGIPENVWVGLPPLFKTESSFRARVGAVTLAGIKINNIVFEEPLLIARRIGRKKAIAMTGYGLWRWQLSHDVLGGTVPELLLSNAIRWLTSRDNDKRIRIRPTRDLFDSGEPVEFTAQVNDESFQPVDDAAVNVTVRNGEEERELMLTPRGAGRYAGTLDIPEEGDYFYKGVVTAEGGEAGKDEGRFSIGELNIEFQETRMNNQLLRRIANVTGGSYFSVSDADGLADAVTRSPDFLPSEIDIRRDIELWNLLVLLAAAVLLFAAEWYLRKQSGMI